MYKMSLEEVFVLSNLKQKIVWKGEEDKDSVICTMLLLSQENKFKEMADWLKKYPNAKKDEILEQADILCGLE